MDTNDLISRLAGNLKPVRTLPSAGAGLLRWGGTAASLVAAAVILGGARPDLFEAARRPAFLFESAALLAAGFLAAAAAFQLRAPQPAVPRPAKGLLAAAGAIWAFEVVRSFAAAGAENLGAHAHLGFARYVHDCLIDLTLMMAAPAAVMFVMLRKGATTLSSWSGAAALLAAASLAAAGMRHLCASDDPAHLLVWHFLPVLVYAGIGSLTGRRLLRW